MLPTIGAPFLYLDPPYYGKGKGLYPSFYEHDDHERIAALVSDLQLPWVVSYDAEPKIEAHTPPRRSSSYGFAIRPARVEGNEVMFFSKDLHIPEVAPPRGTPGDS